MVTRVGRHHRPGRGRHGFTLVELMVVVVIIMLVIGVSLPALSSFSKSKKLEQAGQIIKGALNEARRAAITQRIPHRLVFTKGAIRIYRVTRTPEPAAYVGHTFALPKFVEIVPHCDEQAWQQRNEGVRNLPPDEFPTVDAESGTDDVANLDGYLEFRIDGTAHFARPYQDIPARRMENGRSVFDPGFDPEKALALPDTERWADLVAVQSNLRTKVCLIDVVRTTGKSRYRVIRIGH